MGRDTSWGDYCICSDPENCTQPLENRICRKIAGVGPRGARSKNDEAWDLMQQANNDMGEDVQP